LIKLVARKNELILGFDGDAKQIVRLKKEIKKEIG